VVRRVTTARRWEARRGYAIVTVLARQQVAAAPTSPPSTSATSMGQRTVGLESRRLAPVTSDRHTVMRAPQRGPWREYSRLPSRAWRRRSRRPPHWSHLWSGEDRVGTYQRRTQAVGPITVPIAAAGESPASMTRRTALSAKPYRHGEMCRCARRGTTCPGRVNESAVARCDSNSRALVARSAAEIPVPTDSLAF
jgi:hypothetical protein